VKPSTDDAWLIALGAVVSDGGHVEWERVQERAVTPEQQQLVLNLRQLASVVNAHRTAVPASPDTHHPLAAPMSPTTQWRHLVMFECVGSGAFGRVHRGWDPLLDREVAIKLLARKRAGSSRLLDEARNLARIRHSNVVVVHGADAEADQGGIWMEFIEGQTLAAILAERGAMSPREVAGVGLDLCSALSAIHAAGLVHRDIKAQNVMRETGGRIVLMDFSNADAMSAADLHAVSGTPLYMAPELFTGASATAETDVYSLGVLLFFILSGRFPVEGRSVANVKQAHAGGARNRLRDVRADVPDSLIRVVERATAPDPRSRYHTAGELEHALATASGAQPIVYRSDPPRNGGSRRVRLRTWIGATALMVVTAALIAFVQGSRPGASAPVAARFTVGPPYLSGSWPRVSPDGRLLVFGAIVEGRNRFWIRPLDTLAGRPLLDTTANETPFWSPDSESLCFFNDGKLFKTGVHGGTPQLIADAPHPHGGSWSGTAIIYAAGDGLYKVASTGGTPERLTTVDGDRGELQHAWPEFLPDGRRYLFVIRSANPERSGLYVGSLDGAPPRRLSPAFSRAVYADHRLLYVRDGSLTAQQFNPRSATLQGEPVTIADGVKAHGAGGDAAFDVSPSGVLVYASAEKLPTTRLVLLDSRGRELRALSEVGAFARPRFSPDGQRVAAERLDSDERYADLWLYGVTRVSATRLMRTPAPDVSPVWSPDGTRIAFSSQRGSRFEIYVRAVDSVDERRLSSPPGDKFVEHWSPDGRYLTVTVLKSGLWLAPLDRNEAPRLLRASDTAETWQSEFSPDGRWLAYMSEESGTREVYVEPFPPTGARWQVSTRGGAEPHWRRTGELLYLDASSTLTAVRVTGPGWKTSAPQPLFPLAVPDLGGRSDYCVSPDGRFLIVNAFVADSPISTINVILNWTSRTNR
jgi:serine/threonine protein kinase